MRHHLLLPCSLRHKAAGRSRHPALEQLLQQMVRVEAKSAQARYEQRSESNRVHVVSLLSPAVNSVYYQSEKAETLSRGKCLSADSDPFGD